MQALSALLSKDRRNRHGNRAGTAQRALLPCNWGSVGMLRRDSWRMRAAAVASVRFAAAKHCQVGGD